MGIHFWADGLLKVGAAFDDSEGTSLVGPMEPDQAIWKRGVIVSGNSVYIWYLVSAVVFASACYFVAKAKGRSVVMWTVLGFFFSWIPLLIVAIMPRKQ